MLPVARRALGFHGEHIRYAPGWREKLEPLGISRGGHWQSLSAGEPASRSPITNCYRITLDNGEVIYFKRYNYTIIKPQFYYPLPSKAVVEVFGYHRLKQIGIPTLEVLAVGEQRRRGDLRSAFIITREVEDTTDLESFARDTWYAMPEPERSQVYREISTQVLEQTRRAHDHHFCHHDLKWRNILVQDTAAGYRTIWIDCPRARDIWLRKRRAMIVDLGALARLALSYFSPYEQLRLLRRYLGDNHVHAEARQLYESIQAYLARRPPVRQDLPPRDSS